MQSQNRDQLGVFAECDSEDEELALDYNLLEQRVADAAGTCRHVPTASHCPAADPSSTPTIGGGLLESAKFQTYGTDTCGHASTGCPAAVSLREAVRGPHPYEALASKAAAQLGDRLGSTNGHAVACRVVFAEEDEPGQGMDEHWPRAGASNQVQWNAHLSKAVEGSKGHAEDRQCEIVFMDEEAPAPAPAVFTERERRISTAVGASDASARKMRHKNKTAIRQQMVLKAPDIDKWTNTGITGQVATMDQPEPSSPCEIVFADCTD
ncbi:g4250 [Coccomyxa elongata]